MTRAAAVEEPGRAPRLVERDVPRAGPGDVTAAPITPLDRLCASGTSYLGAPAVPSVPGVQGVGVDEDRAPIWFATSAGVVRSLRVLGYTDSALTVEQRRDALTTVVAEAVAGRLTVTHQQLALADVDAAWTRTSGGRVPEAN